MIGKKENRQTTHRKTPQPAEQYQAVKHTFNWSLKKRSRRRYSMSSKNKNYLKK